MRCIALFVTAALATSCGSEECKQMMLNGHALVRAMPEVSIVGPNGPTRDEGFIERKTNALRSVALGVEACGRGEVTREQARCAAKAACFRAYNGCLSGEHVACVAEVPVDVELAGVRSRGLAEPAARVVANVGESCRLALRTMETCLGELKAVAKRRYAAHKVPEAEQAVRLADFDALVARGADALCTSNDPSPVAHCLSGDCRSYAECFLDMLGKHQARSVPEDEDEKTEDVR